MITFGKLGNCGRLGNQLWQIASTLGIAQTMGQSAGFLQWDYRPYFRVPEIFFPDNYFTRSHPLIQAQDTPLVEHMDPRCRDYLQDLGLWKNMAPQIWSYFQPSEAALWKLRSYEFFQELPRPILSLHIRRGDNANAPNNCHPLRPWSYYESAIEHLDGQFESLLVFSDDLEWCRTAFGAYQLKYEVAFFEGVPRKKEHEVGYRTDPFIDWLDLQVMSMCDLHIISNSTYSWWGAFLSHDPSPIYPKPFFGSDLDYIDTSLMFPDSWRGIDHGQIYV